MAYPRTQNRALQLAVMDLDTKGKPTDEEIAKEWGLNSDRAVRAIRQSNEYQLVVGELMSQAIAMAGKQVSRMQTEAAERLAVLIPKLADRVSNLLDLQTTKDGEQLRPDSRDVQAAASAIRTIFDISGLRQGISPPEEIPGVEQASAIMPRLRVARSETRMVLEAFGTGEMDTIEADYEVM